MITRLPSEHPQAQLAAAERAPHATDSIGLERNADRRDGTLLVHLSRRLSGETRSAALFPELRTPASRQNG